jgi:hypothetical protein
MVAIDDRLSWGGSARNGEDWRVRTPQAEARAPRPRNVRIDVPEAGTIRARWRDINIDRRDSLLASWRVIYCPSSTAGNPIGGEQWADRVMRLGIGIEQVPIRGSGEEMEILHLDLHKTNGYVVVTGISETGLLGYPSEPGFVRLEGSTTALAADVTNPALSYSFQDTTGGYAVMKISPSYSLPSDTADFFGVHIHTMGYMGANVPMEIDSAHDQQGKPGGARSDPWILHIPRDSGLGSGTATFNNGSAAVVRVSGTNFAAGMVGRRMMVQDPNSDTWFDSAVNTFTDINNVTMTSPYTGPTGIRSWVVLNAITFYFVSISVRGSRVADFTTAPSVTI